jgi:hypothetical protein
MHLCRWIDVSLCIEEEAGVNGEMQVLLYVERYKGIGRLTVWLSGWVGQ